MSELITRPAHLSDLTAMSALWYEQMLVRAQQDRRWSAHSEARTEWEHQAMGWLNDAHCAIAVAVVEESVMGYGIAWLQPAPPGIGVVSMGIITELALDAHRYQGGAARALVSELRGRFAEQESVQWMAYVPQRDAVAQAFWRGFGALDWMDWLWIPS
jgi:hypothetical protein